MKFLQIGLGSMGKRRIRNLLANKIAVKNIFGFDLSAGRRQETEKAYGIQTFSNFEVAVKEIHPDVYIISTPPNLHAQYFLYAAKLNKHFFVEVATTDDGYRELFSVLKKRSCVAAPSCNFRYYEPIQKMKQLLDSEKIGRVNAFTHHMGQYLPDWHPWEDYRKFYVSRHATSACREMVPFETQWLQWLLGEKFTRAVGLFDKTSDLELKTADTYAVALQSQNHVVGTLLVDVVSRAPFRTLRILGTEGVIEWDLTSHKIKLFEVKKKKWSTILVKKGRKIKGYAVTTEEMYEVEIKIFLKAIARKAKYPYTFQEEYENLGLLKMIEDNSEKK